MLTSNRKAAIGLLLLAGMIALESTAQSYFNPKQLSAEFESLSKSNPGKIQIHQIVLSPGGHPVSIIEIGTETKQLQRLKSAILVIANPEGIDPLSSYASVSLAKKLLSTDALLQNTWYILPVLNPDALARYFDNVKWENSRNTLAVNDDMDDAVDEDGPNDLNGDGYITEMRVRHPEGIWIVDESDPRLMRRADRTKGEKGLFKLYVEGIDSDGDGQYNEDPPGGINTGINFPHLFKPFTPTGGAWPGSSPEVYGLMKFVFSHPEIAATFTFGSTNFCLVPPEGGRKGSVDLDNISLPDEFVEIFGAEKGKKYSMDEIIEMAQPMVPPGVELTPSMVASFLGLGAVVNPLPEDLAWYKELSDQYKEFLKGNGFEVDRLDPVQAKNGSVELWSYYHLGIPTFSLNFFTIPKPKEEKKEGTGITLDKLAEMSSDEFIALGEEKINTFLKENNAPEQFSAERIIGMLKSGQFSPKQMAAMMKSMPKPSKAAEADPKLKALLAYSDKMLNGSGFASWRPYNHPTLGDVEIGGVVPYTFSTPPASMADSLIAAQLPWVFKLVEKLPKLKIADYKITSLGANVNKLEIWIENAQYLPFPTAMGKRNNQPAPAILLIEADGLEILQGLKRTPIHAVDGLQSVKLTYIVRVGKGKTIQATLESKIAGRDSKQIKL